MAATRSDALKNRHFILETAQTLFRNQSVESVSMKMIATNANIGTGTLYRHFSNKADLCMALIDKDVATLFESIDKYKASEDDLQEQLRFILLNFIELKERNIELLEEIERAGKRGRVLMNIPFYERLKNEVFHIITEMNIVNDPDFHTDILLNSFSADVFDYQNKVKGIASTQFVDRILKIFIRGIK
ncbi:TetR/AcrR family transcriptional regulator [Macrococcus caseolyticus]|uniref:TetR/AcrR family transcriptional regulator n=1 Tax=Macrococcoides caseolyticum TaxID=69966 RepID=UPI0024BC750B|nr:TetR/AcrR family transcriptional regulator [Macrococcus caseolyticus]MDJ1153507.1 TetR/AcrR family transcriptional regulator [Macrococcus caseolyticus]